MLRTNLSYAKVLPIQRLITEFPLQALYAAIVISRGGVPVPNSNTRYWSDKPEIPSGGSTSTTVAALNTAIAASSPGNVFYLQDGTYNNAIIDVVAPDVIVCAETVGGVRFTGNSQLVFNASGCDGIGFNFTDTTNDLRMLDVNLAATDTRIARCTLRALVDTVPTSTAPWSTVNGDRTRICYCTFDDKQSEGSIIHSVSQSNPPTFCRYDHNEFLNFLGIAGAGSAEIFNIGQTQYGVNYFALIDNNYMYRHNNLGGSQVHGDTETLTLKSSRNILIQNVFLENISRISLRAASHTDFYGNFVDGASLSGPVGGLRIIGADNRVLCNYFRNLNSSGLNGFGAIEFGKGGGGVDNASDNSEAAFNTIYNTRKCIGYGATGSGTDLPDLTKLYNNASEKTGSEDNIYRVDNTNPIYGGNVLEPTVGVTDAGITAALPDLTLDNGFRVPTAAGNCDSTGVTGYSSIATIDILGRTIPGSSPHVGCFQAGWDLSTDPQQKIIDAAGV